MAIWSHRKVLLTYHPKSMMVSEFHRLCILRVIFYHCSQFYPLDNFRPLHYLPHTLLCHPDQVGQVNETNFESVLLGLCQQLIPNKGKLNQPDFESCWIVPIIVICTRSGTWGRSTWTMRCWSIATSSSSTSLSYLGEEEDCLHGQIGLERSASWSLIPIQSPRGSRGW